MVSTTVSHRALIGAGIVLGAAAALSGCASAVTYGTGTSTTMQTVSDLTGILTLSGRKNEDEIAYEQRPGLVQPPTNNLPAPEDQSVTAANWPQDPDVIAARQRAANREAERTMSETEFAQRDPGINLPPQPRREAPRREDGVALTAAQEVQLAGGADPLGAARSTRSGSLDEQGRPVRRYLTEPPVEYREPDPNAPTTIADKPEQRRGFSLRRVLGMDPG